MTPRFFRHGELPLVLLAVLAQRPRHGYDVMAELTRIFAPRWRPSPGTVYPAMSALDAEGLITPADPDGAFGSATRQAYALTAEGFDALDERRLDLAALEHRLDVSLDHREGLGPLLDGFSARVAAFEGRVRPTDVENVLEVAVVAVERLAHQRTTQDSDHPRRPRRRTS